jgi:hypothetical protein
MQLCWGKAALLALVLLLAPAWAGERHENDRVWQEVRAAKRQQLRELGAIWFPSWRPNTVARTYLDLAERYDAIDLSGCHPSLRAHVKQCARKAERLSEVLTLKDPGVDLSAVLQVAQKKVPLSMLLPKSSKSGEEATKALAMQLLQQWYEAEDQIAKDLRLDE